MADAILQANRYPLTVAYTEASLDLWDGDRLKDMPEVTNHLHEQLAREPALEALDDIRYEMRANMGVFFAAVWAPTGAPVVVKLNASAIEREWLPEVSDRAADLVPHVYASGGRLGSAEVGWLVLQRAPHHFEPSSQDDCRTLMYAAARFQQVACDIDATTYPIDAAFFETYLPDAVSAGCPGPAAEVLSRLHQDLGWMDDRFPRVRCHGDVHFGNAVSELPGGPVLLVDPIPRTANWAWDAAYAQLTSGGVATPRLVPLLAEARRSLGLPTGDPAAVEQLETVLLAWSSMLWWAIIPFRRSDPWWAGQVRTNLERLASSGTP